MAINSITVTGRLTADPELRALPGGDPVCKIRLAVDDMSGCGKTGYINVTVFGKSGEACAEHLTKGYLVGAHGRLSFREWDSEHGKRSVHEIVGQVEFLAPPRDRKTTTDDGPAPAEAPAAGEAASDDDIPF